MGCSNRKPDRSIGYPHVDDERGRGESPGYARVQDDRGGGDT